MGLAAGQSLSFYELVDLLGVGGMGEVWRARDTRLGREVALKVLPERFASDGERLRRFEREARTLAALQHPNIATLFGIDQVGDTCFIAMELVAGEDLAARLARGALPVAEALDACRQIAEGLEAAHEAGVVHRDLKPGNVRLTPGGVVKLLDFGLAKPLGARAGAPQAASSAPDSVLVSEEGLVLGTPTYMSPEQARGKPVDRRTDVWAFGCVLYECLTGRRAFDGETVADVIAAVLEKEPDDARLPAATPARVRTLLARCFDKDPRRRLRDVGEARVLLERSDEPAALITSAGTPAGRGVLPFAAASLAAGAVLGWFVRAPGVDAPPSGVVPLVFRQVSDLPGTERRPSLAPDAKSFVFVSQVDGG